MTQYQTEILFQNLNGSGGLYKSGGTSGGKSRDCLVVEDAKAGVQAAKAGGMDCAALGDGAKSGLADYNMAKFSDLSEIVK